MTTEAAHPSARSENRSSELRGEFNPHPVDFSHLHLEKPSDSLLKERYLNGEPTSDVHGLLVDILNTQPFEVVLSEDGNRVEQLNWPSQEQDFKSFDALLDRLEAANDLEDKQYQEKETAAIAAMVLSQMENGEQFAPLFFALNDENIKTSPAHAGTTPFVHTKKVAELIRTEGMTAAERLTSRFFAWTHDFGKMVIADQDYFQLHAEISYLILREYFKSRRELLASIFNQAVESLTDESIEQYLKPIRFHHSMEMIQKKVLSEDEVRELISDENLMIFGALSVADASSVEKYKVYSILSAITMIEFLLNQTEMQMEKRAEEILSYIHHVGQLVKEIPHLVQPYLFAVSTILQEAAQQFSHIPEFQEAYQTYKP